MELKIVSVDRFDEVSLLDITTYNLKKYKVNGFALLDGGGVVDIMDFYAAVSVEDSKLPELLEKYYPVQLFESNDISRYMLVDRVIPVAFMDNRIATNVLYGVLQMGKNNVNLMNEVFRNQYFADLIKHCNWVPDILITMAKDKHENNVPYKFDNTFLMALSDILSKSLNNPNSFNKKLPAIAVFNSLTDLEVKQYKNCAYDNPYVTIKEMLINRIINGNNFNKDTPVNTIIQMIEQTGEQIRFDYIKITEKDKRHILDNIDSSVKLSNAVMYIGFNEDIIKMLIYRGFNKIKVTHNKYVTSAEYKVLNTIRNYLLQSMRYTKDDEVIQYIDKFICVPDGIENNRDEESVLLITNLLPMSEFDKYYRIMFEYRIIKSRLYGLEDARYKANLLHHVIDKRKFIKLAKLIAENINKSDIRESSKKKALEHLEWVTSYHNSMYPEEKVEVKDIY